MAWSKICKSPLSKSLKRETPDALWFKCPRCQAILYQNDFTLNQHVCPQCQHHDFLPPQERITHFLDDHTFVEIDKELKSKDPLKFKESRPYSEKILALQDKKGLSSEALLSGYGSLYKMKVYIGIFDFRFMGGSMGCVVGEKLSNIFTRAAEEKVPALIFSSSGGARMQEGILSLMQMAKTCAALSQMKEKSIPMVSILTNPTTGGVAASFATLGDINIAEPGSLIGFAGPRVIQQTIGQSLPEGFQTAEYLLEHGMLDLICARKDLRKTIHRTLKIILKKNN